MNTSKHTLILQLDAELCRVERMILTGCESAIEIELQLTTISELILNLVDCIAANPDDNSISVDDLNKCCDRLVESYSRMEQVVVGRRKKGLWDTSVTIKSSHKLQSVVSDYVSRVVDGRKKCSATIERHEKFVSDVKKRKSISADEIKNLQTEKQKLWDASINECKQLRFDAYIGMRFMQMMTPNMRANNQAFWDLLKSHTIAVNQYLKEFGVLPNRELKLMITLMTRNLVKHYNRNR